MNTIDGGGFYLDTQFCFASGSPMVRLYGDQIGIWPVGVSNGPYLRVTVEKWRELAAAVDDAITTAQVQK